MKNKRAYIGAIFVALVIFGLCAVWHDVGYRAGVRDTEQEPTPMRINTMVISLNASQYNQTWYNIGGGSDTPEELRSPTLHNDSFLIVVDVHWGASDLCGGVFGDPIPHANITVEVLSFGVQWHNYTIERVVISGRNQTETRKIINLYNNTQGRMCATDSIGIAFFGYGSYDEELILWGLRNMVFTPVENGSRGVRPAEDLHSRCHGCQHVRSTGDGVDGFRKDLSS